MKLKEKVSKEGGELTKKSRQIAANPRAQVRRNRHCNREKRTIVWK